MLWAIISPKTFGAAARSNFFCSKLQPLLNDNNEDTFHFSLLIPRGHSTTLCSGVMKRRSGRVPGNKELFTRNTATNNNLVLRLRTQDPPKKIQNGVGITSSRTCSDG